MADTDSAAENDRQQEGRTERRPRRSGEGAPRADRRPPNKRPRPTDGGDAHGESRRAERPRPRMNGRRAAGLAARYLAELTGKEFEGIVGIRKSGEDWSVEVEVLEMSRIPSTTDVLAVYEVTVDATGELVGYERRARYVRGDAREERE